MDYSATVEADVNSRLPSRIFKTKTRATTPSSSRSLSSIGSSVLDCHRVKPRDFHFPPANRFSLGQYDSWAEVGEPEGSHVTLVPGLGTRSPALAREIPRLGQLGRIYDVSGKLAIKILARAPHQSIFKSAVSMTSSRQRSFVLALSDSLLPTDGQRSR